MPPPACPECDALQKEVQRAAAEAQRLSEQTEPLRKSLEASFKPYVEALQHAQEKLMQLEAEHAAWVVACANTFTNPDGTTGLTKGEALVEFSPGKQPVVSYETGAR